MNGQDRLKKELGEACAEWRAYAAKQTAAGLPTTTIGVGRRMKPPLLVPRTSPGGVENLVEVRSDCIAGIEKWAAEKGRPVDGALLRDWVAWQLAPNCEDVSPEEADRVFEAAARASWGVQFNVSRDDVARDIRPIVASFIARSHAPLMQIEVDEQRRIVGENFAVTVHYADDRRAIFFAPTFREAAFKRRFPWYRAKFPSKELALRILTLHELAHVALGHLDAARTVTPVAATAAAAAFPTSRELEDAADELARRWLRRGFPKRIRLAGSVA